MKKMILFLGIITLMAACKAEKEPEVQLSPMEMLAGNNVKSWKLNSATAMVGGTEVDLILNYPCWADNVLSLNVDGTYLLKDEGFKCSNSRTIESDWSFNDDPKQIRLGEIEIASKSFKDLVFDLTKLSEKEFAGITKNIKIYEPNFDMDITAETVSMNFSVIN